MSAFHYQTQKVMGLVGSFGKVCKWINYHSQCKGMMNINSNVPIFSGSNFNNQKFRINAILEKEQLLLLVTDEPPTDDAKKKDFLINDVNLQEKGVIIQGLSDNHLDIFINTLNRTYLLTVL